MYTVKGRSAGIAIVETCVFSLMTLTSYVSLIGVLVNSGRYDMGYGNSFWTRPTALFTIGLMYLHDAWRATTCKCRTTSLFCWHSGDYNGKSCMGLTIPRGLSASRLRIVNDKTEMLFISLRRQQEPVSHRRHPR